MSFNFISETDSIRSSTFNKIIRESENGAFMTKGQYIASYVKSYARTDYDLLKTNYGVDASHGQKVLSVDAMFHINYAVSVPVMWMLVIDEVGLVRKYKIKGDGNNRVGWKPNPAKTELLFERDARPERQAWLTGDDVDEFVDDEEAVISKLLGIETGKQTLVAKVLYIKEDYDRDYYGNLITVHKMRVLAKTGVHYYGTVPKALVNNEQFKKGVVIQFNCTVCDTDKADFAFFKRPSKPSIMSGVVINEVKEAA